MKKLIILFLLTIPLMALAQNKEIEPIEVTHQVSVEDFIEIRKFVFDKKNYVIHGSLYGECPFSQINNDISIFLLLIEPLFNPEKDIPIETYNKIEIKHRFRDKNDDYISSIDLLLKDNQIYLTPYWDSQKTMQTKVFLLDKVLNQIMQVIDK